jgi:hypothetical protein
MVVAALGDRNVWSTDGTHAILGDNNSGALWVVTLNLQNFPNASTIGAKTRLPLAGPYFSYTDPDLVYGLDGTWASSYRVSTPDAPIVHIFDFMTIPGWDTSTNTLYYTLSSDDRWMCAINGHIQDEGSRVGCWDSKTHKTYLLDISGNTVNGNPTSGYSFTFSPGNGLHSLAFGMSDRYLQVQSQGNTTVYWDIQSREATTVIPEILFAGNHSASGFNFVARGHGDVCTNTGGSDSRVFTLKPYAQMNDSGSWIRLNACVPPSQQNWNNENHIGWTNNTNADPALTDKYPVFVNLTMHYPSDPQQWLDGELVALETDGAQQKVWHFLHNFTSAAPTGCPTYLVGPHPSRDGRWVLFNSDWLGALGPSPDCANRMDVFLAELRTDGSGAGGASINPQVVTLRGGDSIQFVTSISSADGMAVTWSMNSTVGNLSKSGLYTAPPKVDSQQIITVTATSVSDPTKSASATITLMPDFDVSVTPGSVVLTSGSSQQFSATVTNISNTTVTWSMSPIIGTLTPDGVYTAPMVTSPQTVTITATSAANSTKSATASVTVTPPAIDPTLTVSTVSCGTTLAANSATTCTVVLTKNTPAGGATVTLTSSNPALTVPGSVFIGANSDRAIFSASTGAIAADSTATITATYNGSSGSATITLTATP